MRLRQNFVKTVACASPPMWQPGGLDFDFARRECDRLTRILHRRAGIAVLGGTVSSWSAQMRLFTDDSWNHPATLFTPETLHRRLASCSPQRAPQPGVAVAHAEHLRSTPCAEPELQLSRGDIGPIYTMGSQYDRSTGGISCRIIRRSAPCLNFSPPPPPRGTLPSPPLQKGGHGANPALCPA
jgi:hypothetical protein